MLSKFVGLALQVETWLVAGLALGFLGMLLVRPRLAKWSSGITLACVVLIGVFPIGELLLRPLEAEFPPRRAPAQIDGILVLGGLEDHRATAQWDQPQVNGAAERLTAAAALALQNPTARLVFSGGSGRLRDAVVGRDDIVGVAVNFFTSLGIDPNRITWEAQSRNTAENASFSYNVIAPARSETWVLVTSAFHMGRALSSFEATEWGAITAYPVDYRTGNFSDGLGWNLSGNLEILNIAIKEWVGRSVYRITDR